MTVDRAGSSDRSMGLAADLAVLFFGLGGAGLLEEAATRFGPSPLVFLFFSTTQVLSDTCRVEWLLTYSEKVLRERASLIQWLSS